MEAIFGILAIALVMLVHIAHGWERRQQSERIFRLHEAGDIHDHDAAYIEGVSTDEWREKYKEYQANRARS